LTINETKERSWADEYILEVYVSKIKLLRTIYNSAFRVRNIHLDLSIPPTHIDVLVSPIDPGTWKNSKLPPSSNITCWQSTERSEVQGVTLSTVSSI